MIIGSAFSTPHGAATSSNMPDFSTQSKLIRRFITFRVKVNLKNGTTLLLTILFFL